MMVHSEKEDHGKQGIIREYQLSGTEDSQASIHLDEEHELTVYTDERMNRSRFKWFWRASYFMDKFGEIRGVERTMPQNRTKNNFLYMLRLTGIWFGATLSLPSMTGFFLGPILYNLSFKSSVSSGVLGALLGSVAGAYGVTMGPRSGLRSMVGVRFLFGWWFGKFISLLNCLTLVGWMIINGNFGGQLLSSLTNERISIQIGILILFLISLVISTFGFRLMTIFDTFFIIPLSVAFLLCYICTAHEFDLTHVSKVSGEDLRTAWVTNFGATIGITSTWLPVASDYHLDMPENTNRLALFFCALAWIFLPTLFVGVLGTGIASATMYNLEKANIYNKFGGAGLIVEGMRRWHGGGTFIVVLMYISLITNSSVSAYSFGLSFQTLAKPIARFPRYLLVILGCIIWYVLTAVGTSGWAQVVSNFMPMIGYWSMIYFVILFIENTVFRYRKENEYEWDQYLNPKHFPIMWSAMFSFGAGVAGVVVGMDQYYYVGRIARSIGPGCEVGTLLAMGFTAVTYLPLRWLEIRLRKDPKVMP